jgi:hypothetical protein
MLIIKFLLSNIKYKSLLISCKKKVANSLSPLSKWETCPLSPHLLSTWEHYELFLIDCMKLETI